MPLPDSVHLQATRRSPSAATHVPALPASPGRYDLEQRAYRSNPGVGLKQFKTHFNLSPETYRASRAGHFATRRTALILEALRDEHRSPRTVLEIGSGTGDILAGLAASLPATFFVGIDVDPGLTELASATYLRPNLTYLCGDVSCSRDLPDSIDFVFSVDVLHHLRPLDVTARSVRERLQPETIWLAIEPNFWHPYVTWQQERMIRAGYDEAHFRVRAAKTLLSPVGFTVQSVRYAHLTPPSLKRVPPWLARLERALERVPFVGASAICVLRAV